jgi:hypothetical protein
MTLTGRPSVVSAGSERTASSLGAPSQAERHALVEAGQKRSSGADHDATSVAVDEDLVAFVDDVANVGEAADDRHTHGSRDDCHVRGQRPFLEQHRLQPAPVIFEELGGAKIARDEDGVLLEAGLGGGAHSSRNDPKQPVRQILKIVHPLLEQGIVDLAHPSARSLLHALDRGFGGKTGIDRLVDPSRPALVIGEHPVGLEDLPVLAGSELGLPGHVVDLFAHLAEGPVDTVALRLDVIGNRMLDDHSRFVEYGPALGHPGNELEPAQAKRPGAPQATPPGAVHQPCSRDQL